MHQIWCTVKSQSVPAGANDFTILRGRFTYQNAGTNQAAGTIHERVLIETLLYVCSLVGIFFVPVLTLSFHKPWVSNFLATSQHNVTCKCF